MSILMWFALCMAAMSFAAMTAKALAVTKAEARLARREVRRAIEPRASVPVRPDVRPVYALISPCPECKVLAAHLLMNLTAWDAARKCVECDHEWHERVA